MPRRLRFVPSGGSLVEVTTRTFQGRFLLKPSPHLNSIVWGVLGRSQRRYNMTLHAFKFLSNHYHLLLTAVSAHQLAAFMGYLNGNLAKEVARLHHWKEKVWSRRYQAILVSDEPQAQTERLHYLLAHGAKEGLVASPREWPGASCLPALLEDKPLEGLWFDRTREYGARTRQETYTEGDFATKEEVHLEPLPCWAHLSLEAYRQRILEMVQEIEDETARHHAETGTEPMGLKKLRRQRVEDHPDRLKRSPAPLVHCASKRMRWFYWEAYGWFYAAFREAAEKLKAGQLEVAFPEGSFPPALPYIGPILEPG